MVSTNQNRKLIILLHIHYYFNHYSRFKHIYQINNNQSSNDNKFILYNPPKTNKLAFSCANQQKSKHILHKLLITKTIFDKQ